ncbi:hypothetical protein EV363DRAFT_1174272 [Boletus edulis]|nr:hypothetical protein EV363DRAFT_1174272 [Boletus edulis]
MRSTLYKHPPSPPLFRVLSFFSIILTVCPDSTCDICLECYTTEAAGMPHAIPCGHIFCRGCVLEEYSRH